MSLGYAYANRLFVLCANRVGTEKGVGYLGKALSPGRQGRHSQDRRVVRKQRYWSPTLTQSKRTTNRWAKTTMYWLTGALTYIT